MKQINGTIKWTRLEKVLTDFANYFIMQAKDNLGKNGSYASGTLADTMEPVIEINDYHYSVKIRLQDYWEYVEKGRKKGGKRPPIVSIMNWVLIKPIRPQVGDARNGYDRKKPPTVKQLAFAIATSIKKNGIPARPFFKPAKEAALSYYKEAIALAIAEDVEAYVLELFERGDIGKGLADIL